MYIICICVRCYSSRLIYSVCTEHEQYSTAVLMVKFMEECTFFPSEMMFFYIVTRGWNLTSPYSAWRMSRLTRDRTAERVSRDQTLGRKRG